MASGNEQGPPNLDEVLKELSRKFSKMFGKKEPFTGVGGQSPSFMQKPLFPFLLLGAIIFLVLWFLMGIFIVNPAEQAVVLRLGKYSESLGPGPHWIPPFIDSKYIVNEEKIYNYYYDSLMLTEDVTIVQVAVAVQYRINNARDFLFNVTNPFESVKQVTASALRQVIGTTTLDDVLTSGRELVRQRVKEQMQKILALYNPGIEITDVALQPAKAPDEVKEAFDDAIKAQEDEQRYVNKADAYSKQIVPIAEGNAKRILAESNAYQQQVVLKARGDTASYLAVLPEYEKAPEVMRDRLYIDVIQQVLSNTSKILVDTKGNNNMLYLPLDKIMEQSQRAKTNAEEASAAAKANNTDDSVDTATNATATPSTASSYGTRMGYTNGGRVNVGY